MPNLAYLSLGSNLDKEKNLPLAVRMLAEYGVVRAVSTVWETAPLGAAPQPTYFNAIVLLETSLPAAVLREKALKNIESRLGRARTSDSNAPRTIDIDIMLFNEDILTLKNRRESRHIPDPEIHERAFVAIPLAEIAPDYVHPITHQTLSEIAGKFHPSAAEMSPRLDICLHPSPGTRDEPQYPADRRR